VQIRAAIAFQAPSSRVEVSRERVDWSESLMKDNIHTCTEFSTLVPSKPDFLSPAHQALPPAIQDHQVRKLRAPLEVATLTPVIRNHEARER